jgi:hypothetical protein
MVRAAGTKVWNDFSLKTSIPQSAMVRKNVFLEIIGELIILFISYPSYMFKL